MIKNKNRDSDEVLPTVGEVVPTRRHQYKTIKLLGRGGFGAVFEVRRLSDKGLHAMKCETIFVKKQVLSMDCKVLRGAYVIRSPHFCTVLDRGKMDSRFRFLVMKLVGRNMWDLRTSRSSMKFSLSTALKAAEQTLMALEDLHAIGFLHRDIKPGNFAIGRPENRENQIIFMLDFGLCRKFFGDEDMKDLRAPRVSAPFRGTTRYASLAALRQIEQSRKDDIEAWLYMIVEWTAGQLPWRKLKGVDREQILQWKEDVRAGESLDEFLLDCPKREYAAIMQYLDSLLYQSVPDYEYVHYCLHNANVSCRIGAVEPLDWDPENPYSGPTREDRDRRIKEAEDMKAINSSSGKNMSEATVPGKRDENKHG